MYNGPMAQASGLIQKHYENAERTDKMIAEMQNTIAHLQLRIQHLERELGTDYDSQPKCQNVASSATATYTGDRSY